MKVGFVGLGRMGMAMATRLHQADFDLKVWNRSEKTVPDGMRVAASLAELVSDCDVVFSILSNDEATNAVHSQMFSYAAKGTCFVEMATVHLGTVKQLSGLAMEHGVSYVDIPVVGTVGPATQGQLLALAGAPAETLTRIQPALDAMCRKTVRCGDVSTGMAMKHCVNSLMGIYFAGLADALGAGSAAGLQLEQMLDVIMDTPAALPALGMRLDVIKGKQAPVAFDVAGGRKDLNVIMDSGRVNGVPMHVVTGALANFDQAMAQGQADQDLAVVARTYLKPAR